MITFDNRRDVQLYASHRPDQNLYYDSQRILWIEYFSITPGAYTQLFNPLRGAMRSSQHVCRVYIAISDGLHGAEVPLQWMELILTG